MPEYTCKYDSTSDFGSKTYDCESTKDAYEMFLQEEGVKSYGVIVSWGLMGASTIRYNYHTEEKKREADETSPYVTAPLEWGYAEGIDLGEKKREAESLRKQSAISGCNFFEERKHQGYFMLETTDKINSQKLFDKIISHSEKGPLFKEEIKYLYLWRDFKDREFGQSLIAKAEAQKPEAERGKSELASSIVTGIAIGNFAKVHQLKEMQEMNETMDQIAGDVEDVNEGFGFE
jgi:hypothetical protein